MNDYCIDLNLPVHPLIEGVSFDDLQKNNSSWTLVDLKYINPDLKKLFQSLGLIIKVAALFVLDGNVSGEHHSDDIKISNLTKVNWSSNTDHNMIWYKIKNPIVEKKSNIRHTTLLTPRKYITYTDTELEEVHRATVGFPSLVQAGIPHNVENYKGVRKCLSIGLYDTNNITIPMFGAKKIFASYIR
jgi:hypothetical protein